MENLGINPLFWSNKKVFLTGHTGFKGSWLAIWLTQLGAEVCAFALPPDTSPNLFDLIPISKKIDSHFGDITDSVHLKKVVSDFQPHIIFHLAAQSLVRYGYQHPRDTYATNVMGTVNILESFRESDTAHVLINVTTDKCYENKEWHFAYRENDKLGGYDPYSNSKACAELVTSAYRQSFLQDRGVATARAGNVIGGGDWACDRLLPDMIRALSNGEKPVIRYPNAIRPWQHVLEPLAGYLLLAQHCYEDPHRYSDAWNFGPSFDDACCKVANMADKVCHYWGEQASWRLSNDIHPHEATFLRLDIAKARQILGWQPRMNVDRAIQKTVAWYKAWLKGENLYARMIQQIKEYAAVSTPTVTYQAGAEHYEYA